MSAAGKCRACGASLKVHPIDAPDARAVWVRLSVRADGIRRDGKFNFCANCSRAALAQWTAGDVQAALLAELRALLR